MTSAASIEDSIVGPPRPKPPIQAFNPGPFFPEGIIAAVIVLLAPFWFIFLLIQGHYLGAVVLGVGVTAFVTGFIAAARAGSQAGSYFAVLGVVIFAGWLNSWLSK